MTFDAAPGCIGRVQEKVFCDRGVLDPLLQNLTHTTAETMPVSIGGDRWDRGLGRNAAVHRTSTLDESLDQIYRRKRTSPPALV